MRTLRVTLLSLSLLAALPVSLHANNVLFYTGPDTLQYASQGTPGLGYTPTTMWAVTDTFTLSSAATVGQIAYSDWANTGYVPASVDWAITSGQGLTNVLASGTGSLTNTFTGINSQRTGCCTIYWSSFNVNVPLAAGTYWLWLDHVVPDQSAWGFANNITGSGVSTQYYSTDNGASWSVWYQWNTVQSFALYAANTTSTPEPASLLLMATGLAGLGARVRRSLKR